MSKVDKALKANTTIQLKKELNQTSKALQCLSVSLDKIETEFEDCAAALNNEKALRDRITALEAKVDEYQRGCDAARRQREQLQISFTEATANLVRQFDTRRSHLEAERDATEMKLNTQGQLQEREWKQRVAEAKNEGRRVQESESRRLQDTQQRLETVEDALRVSKAKSSAELSQRDVQITKLQEDNQNLKHELARHETVHKGKNTEIQIVQDKLATIEAFRRENSSDELEQILSQLQQDLRTFCIRCVANRDKLPGWNQIPDVLRFRHLPRVYYSDSPAGLYVLTAAVQHHVCETMKKHVFLPIGSLANPEGSFGETLSWSNPSHEAIWRLMTANALSDPRRAESTKNKLASVAKTMLSSWKPLYADIEQPNLEQMALDLFTRANTIWHDLMRLRDRIHLVDNVSDKYYDPDMLDAELQTPISPSSPTSPMVPGDFKATPQDLTRYPVLRVFPAFTRTTTTASITHVGAGSPATQANAPVLVRKGTAVFGGSPALLRALREAKGS